jgi:hypothetical protein
MKKPKIEFCQLSLVDEQIAIIDTCMTCKHHGYRKNNDPDRPVWHCEILSGNSGDIFVNANNWCKFYVRSMTPY